MLGLVHLQVENLPQAMEAFKKALELNPDYADAHHNLGLALAAAGRWEEALKAEQKALAIPTYTNAELAYRSMGWAYYNLDRLAEAENALLQALRLEPTLEATHYLLGLVLLKAGRREEAKAAFRRAAEVAPDSVSGLAAREHLKALEGGR
ncbi:MAG: tetratricopeptide repeat protein [Candidatus Rokubacteria bacterium]|nr:tetratricopeptide repeat protein [Candidatus Rokubacteria bacterium]